MTKAQAIESLQDAQGAIEADPDLEGVDTLALMQEAIEDALEHLTGKRPKHVASTARQSEDAEQCEECLESGESTYCGSFCDSCLEKHCEECEVCRDEFC
jgi:hypothetical protein